MPITHREWLRSLDHSPDARDYAELITPVTPGGAANAYDEAQEYIRARRVVHTFERTMAKALEIRDA